jgi:hypothetical protein
MCQNDCNGFPDQCGDSCTDTEIDPSHCGDCFQACDADQVCWNGNCEDYEPQPGCDMCPCDACGGDLDQCCEWDLLGGAVICTEAGGCP